MAFINCKVVGAAATPGVVEKNGGREVEGGKNSR
jgi:hypothetical protein